MVNRLDRQVTRAGRGDVRALEEQAESADCYLTSTKVSRPNQPAGCSTSASATNSSPNRRHNAVTGLCPRPPAAGCSTASATNVTHVDPSRR
jgi:hypothetical protein